MPSTCIMKNQNLQTLMYIHFPLVQNMMNIFFVVVVVEKVCLEISVPVVFLELRVSGVTTSFLDRSGQVFH